MSSLRRIRRKARTSAADLTPGDWATAFSLDPLLRAQVVGRVRARADELTRSTGPVVAHRDPLEQRRRR
jgi:hypothetical protein